MPTTITGLECYVLTAPKEERPHWVSLFKVPSANELLVKLKTNEGIEGFGLATSYTDISPISKVVKDGLGDEILGMDALAPEPLYQKLFGLTSTRRAAEQGWGREALIRISSAVDLACWDIVGKAAGLPLYRLFGGCRNKVPCYVTCAYYRDGKDNIELREEIEMLVAQGHRGFKGKGRGAQPRGGHRPDGDCARGDWTRSGSDDRREQGLGSQDRAIEERAAAGAAEPGLVGEPVRWVDDRRELKLLAQKTSIPLSGGR